MPENDGETRACPNSMTRSGFNPLDVLPQTAKVRLRSRRQPAWVSPMLATLTEKRFSRKGWLFEPKLDGERCLAFGRRGTLRLLSRKQIRLNEKYPEIVVAFGVSRCRCLSRTAKS